MPVSFFHNIGPNLAQIFCPEDHAQFLFFFVDFQWNMFGGSININDFCCNPVVVKKKLAKPLKIAFWGPIYTAKGLAWATPKMKNNFFGRNKKSKSSAFRNFIFSKYHMLSLSYESFYFVCILYDVFYQKRVISS